MKFKWKKEVEIENPLFQPENTNFGHEGSFYAQEGQKRNQLMVLSVIFVVLLVLFSRVIYLQLIKGDDYQTLAENNRVRSAVIKAPRGLIRDAKNEILARNVPSFDAVFVPADLPIQYSERQVIYKNLSDVLGMNESAIASMMDSSDQRSHNAYLIKSNIGYDAALILEERSTNLKGIYVDKTARREYVDGLIFSPVLGYDGKITKEELEKNRDYLMTDYIGKTGLEYSYEKNLHGVHGQHRYEVDSNGNIKEDLGMISPVAGDELALHIDAGLQRKAYEVVNKILEENKDAEGATVVAINPQNGGVLAAVSAPSFDNNLFAQGISQDDYLKLINDSKHPMLNRAIAGEYAPGSTFKPLVAAAALEEGIIDEKTTLNCLGKISIGQWDFPDWKTHGLTDVKKAIAESCDVFFYALGGGWDNISALGMNKMERYANMFGLGEVTGIDLPGESQGLIPTEDWKFKRFGEKWYIGDSYHDAIGQGYVTATPLQLAAYTAAIANGGTVYKPKVVDKIIHTQNSKEEDFKPEILQQSFISAHNIEIVREGMRQTVTDGSAASFMKDLKTSSAGKTGTAQFGTEDKTHSWYVSFAPYDHPTIAMAVLIEGGGDGHSYAVPATRDIYKWYFHEENK